MSLRVRLVVLIVALVTLVALALSALHLENLVNSLSDDALERSRLASQQVRAFVVDHINQHADEFEAATTIDETKALWNEIVTSDRDIAVMLEKMMALSPAIVEINVAGQTGQILASSNPSRLGGTLRELEPFSVWRELPLYRRVADLIVRRPDYAVTVPLGIAGVTGNPEPIFTIQVVASSVLMRDALLPDLRWLGVISGSGLLVSLLLTAVASNWVLRPLKRIEQTIDRIVQGKFHRLEVPSALAKEFAAVETKLNVLGEQFRGAQEQASEKQHSLDQLLERMASELDVATRLAAISRISGGVAHEIKNPLNAISLHLDLLRARIGDPEPELTGIDLQFEALEPAEPMWIKGDADLLKQAMLNLVTNALEAMKTGGYLKLRVGRIENVVTLEVADNGPGIPPDLRDKVFQLYFTTKTRGSGIGLAMTYRAVQLHNGTIDFASEDGRGTTFRMKFPALVGHA